MNRNLTEKQILERIEQSPQDKKTTISCGSHLIVRTFRKNAYYYVRPTHKAPIKIGKVGEIHLKEVRAAVSRILKEYRIPEESIDKHKEEESSEHMTTFKEEAEVFLDVKRLNLAKSSFGLYPNIFNHCKDLFDVPLKDLNNKLIKELVLNKLRQKNSALTARRILHFIRQIMDLAVEDEIIQSHNLNILLRSASFPKVKIQGYKFIFLHELKTNLEKLGSLSDIRKAFLIMLLFTCLRSKECCSISLKKVDYNRRIIVIPAEQMKIKTEDFKIPLTSYMERLISFIKEINKDSDYLFKSDDHTRSVFLHSIRRLIKGCHVDFNLHGFRKTARSWFAEQNIPLEIAAKCLAHTLNFTGADRFYQKSDLLEVMEKWNKAVYDNLPDDYKILLDKKDVIK